MGCNINMERIDSERIRKLNRLGQMNQDLVRGDDLIEEVAETEVPRQLPLMLFVVIGLSLTMAVWIIILILGIGNATVQTTLGNHFMK